MTILVTGGAGYIGSHAVLAFRAAGYPVVVVDDLSAGRRDLLPEDVPLIIGNAGDQARVARAIQAYRVDAVAHFAGSIIVPESVELPLKYYENNTCVSRSLIECCVTNGVPRFIFSSTAAVYGTPSKLPVSETAPAQPESPYGHSKWMTEVVLRDTAAAHGLSYVALRYFNVAGADPEGRSGQCSRVSSHLIKLACQTALGRRAELSVFGDDYTTPDGTCVRDYIHVTDLAAAHVDALRYLENGGASGVFNCGYGRGYSVKEVIAAVEQEIGRPLPTRPAARRAGDPVSLVADASALRRACNWSPRCDDLRLIVRTALAWERQLESLP
jgi:UDP-glucose 4-epimerase